MSVAQRLRDQIQQRGNRSIQQPLRSAAAQSLSENEEMDFPNGQVGSGRRRRGGGGYFSKPQPQPSLATKIPEEVLKKYILPMVKDLQDEDKADEVGRNYDRMLDDIYSFGTREHFDAANNMTQHGDAMRDRAIVRKREVEKEKATADRLNKLMGRGRHRGGARGPTALQSKIYNAHKGFETDFLERDIAKDIARSALVQETENRISHQFNEPVSRRRVNNIVAEEIDVLARQIANDLQSELAGEIKLNVASPRGRRGQNGQIIHRKFELPSGIRTLREFKYALQDDYPNEYARLGDEDIRKIYFNEYQPENISRIRRAAEQTRRIRERY